EFRRVLFRSLLDLEAAPPILRCRSVVSKCLEDLLECDAVRSDATGELFDGFARGALHAPERDEVQLRAGRGVELELAVDRDFRASCAAEGLDLHSIGADEVGPPSFSALPCGPR